MNIAATNIPQVIGSYASYSDQRLLRPLGPIGDAAGYASLDAAVDALRPVTADDTTAAITLVDGRYHGVVLGYTGASALDGDGLRAAPAPFDLRGLLNHGGATTIDFIAPGYVGLVDGGQHGDLARTSGVFLKGTHVALDEAAVAPLKPLHRAEHDGSFIDLAAL